MAFEDDLRATRIVPVIVIKDLAHAVPLAKALGGPFPQVRFCPTGGIGAKNLSSYLSLPNVVAAGGSWMVPSDLSETDAFARAAVMAREAHNLSRA